MKQAFVAPDLAALLQLLNRQTARTRTVVTHLSQAVFDATQLPLQTTFYYDVHFPMETGWLVRAHQLLPGSTVTHASGATYATVALGIRRKTKFDVIGNVYDSRTRDLFVGAPLLLGQTETQIPSGAGVSVRVVIVGTPIPALLGSSVETFLGYDGG